MFAFRVSREIRGKGFGRMIQAMMTDNLLLANPDLKTALSAVPNRDMTDEEMTSSKHGQLLTVKAYHTLKLKWSDLSDRTDIMKCSLQRLTREEFSDLLLGQSLDQLFEGEVIHMNWVPVKIDIKDKKDIEFVTRKKQIVLVDSAKDSLSILTLPYPVSGGARDNKGISELP